MAKVIIYDNKNFLIGDLEGKTKKNNDNTVDLKLINYKVIKSHTIRKLLKKIEKAIRFHKES